MNSNDYFMRQIEDMAQFLVKTFFHKITQEVPVFDEQGMPLESGVLYGTIKAMAAEGNINEAENLLFEKLENQKRELGLSENALFEQDAQQKIEEYLNVAVKFYEQLNNYSDSRLMSCGFSREEIYEGLSAVKRICEEM